MRMIFRRIADYIRECDKFLYITLLVTTLFGCVMVLSTTYNYYGQDYGNFFTQLGAMVLGFGAIIVISNFDYKNFSRFWFLIALAGLVPVGLTFFIGFAPGATDDKAWLMLPGNISFQPSELLKICFILTFAYHCHVLGDRVKKFLHVILLCIHGGIPVVLIHIQGDDGTALIFAIMFVAMMFAAGVKARYFIIAITLVVIALPFIYLFVMNEDQQARINALFFGAETDYLNTLYQQYRGRIGMANGGVFGQGLFKGTLTQSGGIPYAYNDFIYTAIGEELGLFGCLLVLVLISAISIRILRIGFRSRTRLGLVICTGVFAMIVAQTIINIGMCLWLLPVIGVALPFFSAGGTTLLCTYLGLAVVMSVHIHRDSGSMRLRDKSLQSIE
ncbi:MAG: FtsW/RodA/SpoVE family cell cycle protein [Clostridia bacterium]|nr:FtsW/RodA/SpoVE family cell cycle protein [Clostridia bacterium]